jgi:hypothetical protein
MGARPGVPDNNLAVRPVGILDLGIVKAKVGFEYGKQTPRAEDAMSETSTNGFGGSLQVVLHPYVELGGGFARQFKDVINTQGVLDNAGSTTVTSYGGFANGRVIENLLVGVGYHHTELTNLEVNITTGGKDKLTHAQMFAAIQYALWKQLYIKVVAATATANFEPLSDAMPTTYESSMKSARMRLLYNF